MYLIHKSFDGMTQELKLQHTAAFLRLPNPPQFEDSFGNRDPLQSRLAFLVLDLDFNVSLPYDFLKFIMCHLKSYLKELSSCILALKSVEL